MYIEENIDEYGFPKISVTTAGGGRISVSDYRKENDEVDIGSVSMMNEGGLGSNSWIRNKDEIDKHISSIRRVTWINEESRKHLIDFLERMK